MSIYGAHIQTFSCYQSPVGFIFWGKKRRTTRLTHLI